MRKAAVVASSFASAVLLPAIASAQGNTETPIVPSSTIGPVSNGSTFSLLGVTALPEAGGSVADRNILWFGATQPVARIAGVRLTAIGSGFYRPTDVVGSKDATEATVSLRALARIGGVRTWSALSYGRSVAQGNPGANDEAVTPLTNLLFDYRPDTAYSRREDHGALSRAEVGILTASGGIEIALGLSVERATRITTRRTTLTEDGEIPVSIPAQNNESVVRRDAATGLASASFKTGNTNWLLSVTSPLKNWVDVSSNAPRPQRAPTVASIAFMQPLSAWLSVIGAASTNATTVGTYAIRDDHGANGQRKDFAPVIALGVRIARYSVRNRPGEPIGILAVETRTIGIIDAVTAETLSIDSVENHNETGRERVRVLLVIDAPRAESVELMGDATGWSVMSLSRARDGKWRAELRVPPGIHRISMRADGGNWIAPPGMLMGTDDYGTRTGVMVVRLGDKEQ